MKISFYNLCSLLFFFEVFVHAQDPFLEIRPFAQPSFEQFSSRNHVDHHYPSSNIQDGFFLRFDGKEFDMMLFSLIVSPVRLAMMDMLGQIIICL